MLGVEAHLGGATGDIDNATALIEAALKLLQDAQNAVDVSSMRKIHFSNQGCDFSVFNWTFFFNQPLPPLPPH